MRSLLLEEQKHVHHAGPKRHQRTRPHKRNEHADCGGQPAHSMDLQQTCWCPPLLHIRRIVRVRSKTPGAPSSTRKLPKPAQHDAATARCRPAGYKILSQKHWFRWLSPYRCSAGYVLSWSVWLRAAWMHLSAAEHIHAHAPRLRLLSCRCRDCISEPTITTHRRRACVPSVRFGSLRRPRGCKRCVKPRSG